MHPTMTRVGVRPGRAQCPQHSPGTCPMPRPTVPSQSPHLANCWHTTWGALCREPHVWGLTTLLLFPIPGTGCWFSSWFSVPPAAPPPARPPPIFIQVQTFYPSGFLGPSNSVPTCLLLHLVPPRARNTAKARLASPPSQALAPKLSSPSSDCCFAELAPTGPAAPCSTPRPASDLWFSAIS